MGRDVSISKPNNHSKMVKVVFWKGPDVYTVEGVLKLASKFGRIIDMQLIKKSDFSNLNFLELEDKISANKCVACQLTKYSISTKYASVLSKDYQILVLNFPIPFK